MEAAAHPNLDVVNHAYQALAEGDLRHLEDLLAPDVVLHVSGREDVAGRDRLMTLVRAGARGGTPVKTAVHDILWSPEHVVVLLQVQAGSKTQNIVQVIHTAGGAISEIWEYLWDPSDGVFAQPGRA